MFDPQSDYRLDGRETVIACAKDGEVRGYLPAEGQEMTMGGGKDESMMKELQERKQEYMQQLRALEQNIKSAKSGDTTAGVVPADTRIDCRMETNHSNQSLDMVRGTVGCAARAVASAVTSCTRVLRIRLCPPTTTASSRVCSSLR